MAEFWLVSLLAIGKVPYSSAVLGKQQRIGQQLYNVFALC
jgi:hypothetical protein